MNALLIVAHGSRRAESNEEVRRLARQLGEDAEPGFDRVACAFLEICPPAPGTAIDALVADGSGSITVFPFFLSAGTHVADDIPRIVGEGRRRHRGVAFRILPHLGALPGLVLVLGSIGQGTAPVSPPAG